MILVWLIHLSVLGLVSWRYYRASINPRIGKYYWYGLFTKIIGGLTLGALYLNYFEGGDTWAFFNSSKVLSQLAQGDPTTYFKVLIGGSIPERLAADIGFADQPRALLMVKIMSPLTLMTGGSYWLVSIYFSLFAFSGLWALVRNIAHTYSNSHHAALAAFIFYPSLVFWGSGVTKETVFIGGLGWLVSWYWPYFQRPKRKIYQWLIAVLLALLMVQLKYYYMGVFVSVLGTTIICEKVLKFSSNYRFVLMWLSIFIFLVFIVSWLHPNLRLDYLALVIKENAQLLELKTNTPIEFIDIKEPIAWMTANFPWAVITGILRPNLWDWGNLAQNLAVFENILILVFLFTRLRYFQLKEVEVRQILPCIIYVVILSGLLTLATPNFGTLVRYKVSFMPVLLFLILYKNPWWERLTAKLP